MGKKKKKTCCKNFLEIAFLRIHQEGEDWEKIKLKVLGDGIRPASIRNY